MKITNLIDPQTQQEGGREQFAIDVLTGLCSTPKQLASKYFYDDAGSELFRRIMDHPDYYPTATEAGILQSIHSLLPELVAEEEVDIIELGAGDGIKSLLVVEGFLAAGCRVNYYPIDISEKAMAMLADNLSPHERLAVHGVVADYFDGLRLVRGQSRNRQMVLFLGSNIGNFDRVANQGFLRKLWISLDAGDYLLLGFDLKKDVDVLTRAYNDGDGHTRAFNLNLLRRINSELGGEFDLDHFQHLGVYNPMLGAMESFVVSTRAQEVYIAALERAFHFEAYEAIHLEYSFKFLPGDIDYLSRKTGFEVMRHFSDPRGYFIDSLWRVVKDRRPGEGREARA